MASGTYNLSLEHSSSSVSFQGKLEWTSTSNGTSANSSNVVVKLYARKQGSTQATSGTFKGSITIDGTKATFSQSKSVSNSWVLISTSSKTVSHNADGNKSITIAGEVGKVSGTTLANINSTGSTSITLDTIPRYATIVSSALILDTDAFMVNLSTPAYGNYGNVEICVSRDMYSPIDTWHSITPTEERTTYQYRFSQIELNSIYYASQNTNRLPIYIMVRSSLNGVSQTDKFATEVVIVEDQPDWDLSTFSIFDTDNSVISITGSSSVLVQGKSNISITFPSATAKKNATISSYEFKLGSYTFTTASSGTLNLGSINENGQFYIQCTAIDSRGFKKIRTIGPYLIYEYYLPQIASYELKRVNNYENTTNVKITGTFAPLNNTNTITCQYRYQEVGGSYNAWTNIANDTQIQLTLNNQKEYYFDYKITDAFGSSKTISSIFLGKGRFPLFIDTALNSLGVNRFPEMADSIEIGGTDPVLNIIDDNEDINISLGGNSGSAILSLAGTDADILLQGESIFENKILWDCENVGYYMIASQTATLSENVSAQRHGIVLVWSAYASGSVQNYNWHCDFIPKEFVNFSGRGYLCIMASSKFTNIATKYVYIHDDRVVGNADNNATGTGSGITYTNNAYVLRYVIGV